MIDIKAQIQSALNQFSNSELLQNAKFFLNTLGYESERTIQLSPNTFEGLSEYFDASKVDEKKAMKDDWQSIDIIFQITQDNIRKTQSLFQLKQVDNKIIESYLFFALSLKGGTYNRSDLVRITREINKLTPMPSMILFRYNNYLTIAVIDRRLHKRETSKDVLEKVTLIKDINIQKPHRAHIEILYDLSLQKLIEKYSVGNFVELHNSWQKTLDTSELNKKFYRELANWYFWAVDNVEFPDDEVKDRSIRNATNLIRLITRIIFIWFIKEKDLVPENLFNKNYLNNILNDFNKNNKSHSYYQAILQNLFFGTLNQKMGERGFVREGSFHENKNEYGVKNLFRYADRFTIKEKEVIELFKDIPFLNGGLFDCLDKPNDENKIIYADGFTRNIKKQAAAPDFLFFGDEQDIDLNKIFGTKNKKYKVQGLINLLESYKFTVAENTPIEEEIALDPELLGKVFENLLASYNPETQTTARKQTGSFYTPREIVNYMVDESLIAYLSSKLPSPLAGEPACSADRGKNEGGFDVVIGNPPYVRADSPAFAEQRKLIMQSNQYETLWEKWDLMVPFYEKSLRLLNHEGINAFIASNSITTSKFAYKLQDWILKNYKVKSIDYFEDDMHIFEAGVVPVVTIIMKTKQNVNPNKIYRADDFTNIASTQEVDISESENLRERVFKKSFSSNFSPKIDTEKLGDICYISYGLRPNSDERYWKGEFTRDDLISETKDATHPKAYVEGKLIKRYAVEKIMYLEWDTDRVPKKLVRPTFPELYNRPKILSGRVTGAIYDDTVLVCNDSIVVFVRFIDLADVNNKSISGSLKKFNTSGRKELEKNSKNYDLKYLLAVLNSKYANFSLNNHRRHRLENYFYPDDFRNLPIPVISPKEQQPFITLVDQILAAKKKDPNADTSAFERQIDEMVYELYGLTPEEIEIVKGKEMEQKCLKCGEVMFKKVPLDDLHWAIDSSTPQKLENDGNDYFYMCSKCEAKNVVISYTSPKGVEQFKISHVKEK